MTAENPGVIYPGTANLPSFVGAEAGYVLTIASMGPPVVLEWAPPAGGTTISTTGDGTYTLTDGALAPKLSIIGQTGNLSDGLGELAGLAALPPGVVFGEYFDGTDWWFAGTNLGASGSRATSRTDLMGLYVGATSGEAPDFGDDYDFWAEDNT